MINLTKLLEIMKRKGWHITAFLFRFNKRNYIVLFEDLDGLSLVKEGNQVLLTFIDRDDEERMLRVKANDCFFDIEAKKLRQFFGIGFSENLRNEFMALYTAFNRIIPNELPMVFEADVLDAVINRLDENDGSSGRCCYRAMRNGKLNGKPKYRTPFNTDKTKLLRPELFELLGNDRSVSFCFREENPLCDKEILELFQTSCNK